jgi:uncharacterized membrane protein YdjX (TVP38/TMEM64 family)
MSEGRSPVRWWVWLLAGLVLAALIAALIIWWRPIYDFLSDPEQVRTWVEQLGAWGPVAIILLEMIQALLPMIGMVIGSFITFSLSRRFGRPLVIRLIGKQSMARMDDLVRRGGALFFFLIWLLPFAPDDLACVAAGLTPMPIRQFLILMTVGRLPGVFVSVLVGANVSRINPIWWVVLFAGIALAAAVFWRWGEQIQEVVLGHIERLSDRSKP